MHLNGWQRLAVVLVGLWTLVWLRGAVAVTGWSWRELSGAFAVWFIPIATVVAAFWVTRWVWRGFQPPPGAAVVLIAVAGLMAGFAGEDYRLRADTRAFQACEAESSVMGALAAEHCEGLRVAACVEASSLRRDAAIQQCREKTMARVP